MLLIIDHQGGLDLTNSIVIQNTDVIDIFTLLYTFGNIFKQKNASAMNIADVI